MFRTILKVLLPLILVAAGVGFAVRMVKTRPKAKKTAAPQASLVVDVVTPTADAGRANVEAQGTVTADRVVQLSPQVSGLVERIGVGVEPGARLAKGDVVAVLDDRDYQLALDQREAEVARAQFELDVERGRAQVADREWAMLGASVPSSKLGASLAQRKPHIEAAKARLDAAKSGVTKAKLDISRTKVVAPFDCVVRERRVAEGQLVTPQTPLAVLVATDRFFVTASVPVEVLGNIDVPGLRGVVSGAGAEAFVVQRSANGEVRRRGRVERLLSELDPAGRMARLLVAVDKPLDPPEDDPDGLPLLLGSYVGVTILGRPIEGVRVPRLALREGNRVWTVEQGQLTFKDVEVVWRAADTVVIRGIEPSAQIVVSRIPAPEPGMKLEVRGAPVAAKAAEAAPTADAKAERPAQAAAPRAAEATP